MEAPYRTPGEAPDEAEAAPPPDGIGAVRSVHRPTSFQLLGQPLLFGAMLALAVVFGTLHLERWDLTVVLVAVIAVGAAIAAAVGLRGRRLEIRLCADGLAVERPPRRDSIVFEDVDEVWLEFDRSKLGAFIVARVARLRLVRHDGSRVDVPLGVEDALRVFEAVVRRCSMPLLAEAERALNAGETLTFGPVELTRDAICVRSEWSKLSALSRVRLQPGRVVLFRNKWMPWKTIGLESVPHPTVFVKLLMTRAKHVEVDDPLAAA